MGYFIGNGGGEPVVPAEPRPVPFGELLRKLRADAGLTQEELASSARLSVRAVSDLERGVNQTARKDTARLLADALRLDGATRAAFEAVARGRSPADGFAVTGPAGAMRTLPRDVISFTGRAAELRLLTQAVSDVCAGVIDIYAIGGMPGIGKTAFAVHAAHQLAPQFPDGQIFLPLHGHTPGQRPVDPADALASLLLTAGIPADHIPSGTEARAALWRDRTAGRRLLLVLDDAVGSDQVRSLLPGGAGALVLVTSRRHLAALEDARAISLDALAPEEAVGLLIRAAASTTPGDAADEELREIARLCGHLPLALGMIARQLRHHPAWAPADLRAELAAARDRLELMAVENVSVAAAFDLSYRDLAPAQQRLFRRLGLHPAAEFDVYAAAALDGTELSEARRSLTALYDYYLVAEPARGRYRMHDLIREHARALSDTDPDAETDTAVRRLLDYYVHTARSADNRRALYGSAAHWGVTVPVPRDVPDLPTWDSKADWMGTERHSLSAAVGHAAAHGLVGHAAAIADAMHVSLTDAGLQEQADTLHGIVIESASRAGDGIAVAHALANRSDLQRSAADYQGARSSLDRALVLYRERGHEFGEAWVLGRLGRIQYLTDDLKGADSSLRQALALFTSLGEATGEAGMLRILGAVGQALGDYPAARTYLTRSVELERRMGNRNGEMWGLVDLGALEVDTGDYDKADDILTRVLELSRADGNRLLEQDTLIHLGNLRGKTGDIAAAASSARQSLDLSIELGNPLGQANALHLLGRLQVQAGQYSAAADGEQRALALYRGMGNQEGEADVLACLGDIATATGSIDEARARYHEALAIGTNVPLPLQEAQALEGIGRSCLADGQTDDAAAPLRRALRIYRDLKSPRAAAIEATLGEHGL
jgi:tetratricopeptide (TPR) repeat protein/transcriptional regulator with XRE-family HTH domain